MRHRLVYFFSSIVLEANELPSSMIVRDVVQSKSILQEGHSYVIWRGTLEKNDVAIKFTRRFSYPEVSVVSDYSDIMLIE